MATYLSAKDFLSAIVGEEEDFMVPGVGTVRIRPLTVAEVRRIYAMAEDDADRMALAVGLALVKPQLDDAETRQLLHAAAGRMTPLIQRVMELAAMIDADEGATSLAGAGS